jgi:Protein of unknown function (DUF2612)
MTNPNPDPILQGSPQTDDELAEAYASLLIVQYANLVKAYGMTYLFVLVGIADQIVSAVLNGFNFEVETWTWTTGDAEGVQLDLLGQYMGIKRGVYGFVPEANTFTMPTYGSSPSADTGFLTYGETPNCQWLTYSLANLTYMMSDAEMTQVLQWEAQVRSNPLTLGFMDDLTASAFPTNVVWVLDNQDMTITYHHKASMDGTTFFPLLDAIKLLPSPAGVSYSVTIT